MNCRCHELCKYDILYPKGDVTLKHVKLWELKGFVWCKNCDILLSRDKYIHEVRCRCCNGKLKIKPRNTRKRHGPRKIIDYSDRFCLECGSTLTYIARVNGKLRPKWYTYKDGYSCNNCMVKRMYKIKKIQDSEVIIVYNK